MDSILLALCIIMLAIQNLYQSSKINELIKFTNNLSNTINENGENKNA